MANFIKPKVLKRRAWKTLNVLSTLAIVVNTGMVGVLLQPSAVKAANPSANLDQCANDQAPSPNTTGCATAANEWVNGNVNESKSVYLEGDSVPYRLLLDNLSIGTHNVVIEWDTTKADKHALDYITTYNRTVADANPCLGVTGCGTPTTFPIPVDPQVSGAGVTPVAGNFTLFGGTISGVSAYSYPTGAGFTGDKSARITITFNAAQANPVLAWGGHIATRTDWGNDNSAVAISGSPYHTRLIDLDGAGGNQDRSLAAAAVIYPGSVTIVKQATPEGAQSFAYTTNLGNGFSLVDDGTAANTKVFSGITDFTDDNTGAAAYTVTETALAGWILDNVVCTDPTANSSGSAATRTATIEMVEGENISCTFSNSADVGAVTVNKVVDANGYGTFEGGNTEANVLDFDWGMDAETPARDMGTTANSVATGAHNVTEDSIPGYHVVGWYPTGDTQYSCANPKGTSATAAISVAKDATTAITFCNAIDAGSITIIKDVVNALDANDPSTFDFTLSGTAADAFALGDNGQKVYPSATTGYYKISEARNTKYDTQMVCTSSIGSFAPGYDHLALESYADFTLRDGEDVTCTFTNTFNVGRLKVTKALDVDGRGTYTIDKDLANTLGFRWALDAESPAREMGTLTDWIASGSHTVTENDGAVAGYHFTGWYTANSVGASQFSCTNPEGTTLPASVTVPERDTVQLIFCNARDTGSLTVIKHVVGSNEPASSWTMNVAGPTPLSFAGQDTPGVTNAVFAGTYTVTESGPTGYTLTYSGACDAQGTLTIANGEHKTCTLTNTRDTGKVDGYKFNDLDGDGTWDQGEPVIAGVLVTLSNGWTDTTDAQGYFSFENVPTGTYTATESLGAGWTNTTPNPVVNIGVTKNTTTSIIFGNFKLGRISGYKYDTLQNTLPGWEICLTGGAAPVCDTTDGNGFYEFTGLTAGTYTVAETLQQGWWAISPLIAGYIVPVTSGTDEQRDFTNFQGIDLKVNKLMDADGNTQTSGDQTSKSGWTIELWKNGNLFDTQVTDVNGSYTWTNLGPADYTVKEIFDANVYQALTPTQFSFTAVSGQDKEYTFVNFKTPKLTVIKHVINDNGGTASADDFTMTVGGNNVSDNSFPGDENGTTVTLNAGAYSVDELAFPGYAKTLGANCSGTVYSGDEVTCTITNDDIQPKLTVTKIVVNDNGGDAVISDFDLFVDATQVVSGVTNGYNVGNYVISEATVTQPGYTGTITGDCDAQGNVSLALADDKTCTITNDDQPSTITLVKSVTNDNGGNAQPNDFQLTIGGNATLSGVAMPVQANTPYALDETQVQGYSFVSLTGDAKCPRSLGDTVTVDEGEHITCTITNDDEAPTITLVKNVINDNGGNAQPNDFQLTIGGVATLSGVPMTVNANQAYALNETQLTGYDFVSLTGNAKCPAVLGGTATLDEGEDITCTITNDDQAPLITLVKNVVTDNGGTAQPNDFQLTIGGNAALSGVTYPVNANTAYALNETQVFGYDFVSLTGDQKCPAVLGGTVTLDEGEDITCTITNDDIAPQLTLVKQITNDNGGNNQASEWTLTATGNQGFSETGVQDANLNKATVGPKTVMAKVAYTLSETGPGGYDASSWNCVGGSFDKGAITLTEGQTATCTITNDDIAPTITLNKIVVTNNGGTAGVNDFGLTVGGTAVDSGDTLAVAANSPIALNEAGLAGYSFVSLTGDAKCPSALNGTVTLDEGENITCTITNDDIAPSLTLNKIVDNGNGGTEVESAWTLTADGGNAGTLSGPGAAGSTDVVSGATFNAGTYNLSESTGPSGYAASDWSCVKNGGQPVTGSSITLGLADTATCTITNDDIQPKLVVTKHVINDNLGTAVAGDFTLNVTGVNATPASFAGDENGTNVALDAGAYNVDENFYFGYAKTLGQDCSGTINVGETKYCTITNDDQPGRVTGNKFEDVNRNGIWDGTENGLANWTFNLRTGSETGPIAYTTTSDANGYYEFTGVNIGTYYLTEEVKAKWDQITPSNPGYFVVTVTPGYDTLAQCDREFSIAAINLNPQCGFIFGNAPRITLDIAKYNDHEVGHGGTGVAQTTDTINYRIDWSVAGNSIATNVVLTDIIPAQLTLNIASISNGGVWDAATRTIMWNYGTQQPNASGFVTYTATIIVPIANGTTVTNTARISADNADPKFAQDTSTFTVASAPQLQITKTVNATIVNPGDPVTYTVKVKNIGTDTAINAVMTDTLPAGFTFVSTSPTAASIVGQTGTWNLGNMAVGDEKTITYTVNVAPGTAAGTYDNLAKAKADNASEVSTKVTVEVRVPEVLGDETSPVLQLRKAVSKSTVAPGDVITYTVEIENTGTGSAINVILTDLLPAGFTFKGTTLTMEEWKLGDIAVGETKKVSYQVTVGSGVPNGSYENLAIAQADNHGKVTASVPVNVKRGRVLAETIDTGASATDLGIAGLGLGLIILGYTLTRRKSGNAIA
jgi:uncharacterized repeat protein (TIGR01451 family)